jgi:ribosomal protein S15P/S13E
MKLMIPAILVLAACIGCEADPVSKSNPAHDLESLTGEYLFLELSMGWHDDGHVDAYFGPESIRSAANDAQLSLPEIRSRAKRLQTHLAAHLDDAESSLELARIDGLERRLVALDTRIALQENQALEFDAESVLLFGAAAPDHDAAYFEAILEDIDTLLGGEGDLSIRVNEFRNQFVIPEESLETVFDRAIAECRRRTLQHIELPAHESFSIEYVNDKPWSGYNWYQGDAQSLIQINTDLPIFISRAVDLGCHEGYPGHHTFNALLEQKLVKERDWQEFSIYPLFSPQSLIAEGSGNYGIELAFPGSERIEFEKEVLFPLAGLDAAEADRYYELLELLARLDYAGNEAARDYLNGTIGREAAVQWLVDYSLSSPERAKQRTEFFDTYRSYVINYNLGKDLVREYVERDAADITERWRRFETLLSTPTTAADLNRE